MALPLRYPQVAASDGVHAGDGVREVRQRPHDMDGLLMGAGENPAVIPAYLGWGNPERDTVQLRLYATDEGSKDRWDDRFPGGRVVEYAVTERHGTEGDRYLVVRVGNRFTTDGRMTEVTEAIESVLRPAVSGDAAVPDGSQSGPENAP